MFTVLLLRVGAGAAEQLTKQLLSRCHAEGLQLRTLSVDDRQEPRWKLYRPEVFSGLSDLAAGGFIDAACFCPGGETCQA